MELKLKLLAVVGTVALGTWLYTDFIDTDPIRKTLEEQTTPFIIVEDQTFENTVDTLEKEVTGQDAEPVAPIVSEGQTRPVKKSSLTPQGPLFAKPAPNQAPAIPEQITPRHVTLEEALAAALDGSEDSLRLLQNYFDATSGLPEEISKRVSALLEALGALPLEGSGGALEEAAKRIVDAAARAASSAYVMPYQTLSDFALNREDIAWDFGPDGKIPHRGFMRIGPKSRLVDGKGLVALEAGKENIFLKDGILNVERFGVPEMGEGSFRVFIVTAPLPSGSALAYPFGRKFGFNGNELRMVKASESDHWLSRNSAKAGFLLQKNGY